MAMGMTRDIVFLARRTSKLNCLLNKLYVDGKLNSKHFELGVRKMKSHIINPMSHAERKRVVLSVYADVDKQIEKQQKRKVFKTACNPGCAECCSHYFYISYAEFLVVLDYMNDNGIDIEVVIEKAVAQKDELQQKYPFEYSKLNKKASELGYGDIQGMFKDNNVPDGIFKCPLIDDENRCLVYPARSLICRYYGFDRNYKKCKYIKKKVSKGFFRKEEDGKKLDEYMYFLDPMDEYVRTFDEITIRNQTNVFPAAPLFWWFATHK